jgi:hypothetical protein
MTSGGNWWRAYETVTPNLIPKQGRNTVLVTRPL